MMKQTKRNSRLIALLLIFALLLTTGLFSSCQTTEPPEGEDPTDAETTGGQTETSTQEVIGGKYAKLPNTATLDEKFRADSVLIGIQPYAIHNEYTAESFLEVGCLEITGDYRFPSKDSYNSRHLALKLPTNSKEEVLQAIDQLLLREDVWYAHPSYIHELDTYKSESFDAPDVTLPNDGIYTDPLWDNRWALEKIMMPDAWDYTTGSSTIKVGIIDSGIDGTHPDLDNQVNASLSRTFYGSSSPLIDEDGHGTFIAGIIGAEANNQSDSQNKMVGVCRNVQLVSLKTAIIENGKLIGLDVEALVNAILYASENDIDVLNYSASGTYNVIYTPLVSEAIENYHGVFVCSAGNYDPQNPDKQDNDQYPRYPSNFDFVNLISVSGSTMNDTHSMQATHYGANTVDIFAPGAFIYSTRSGGGYDTVQGVFTSPAVPYVTGVAALMLSYNPDLTPAQIKAIIMNTADTVYKNGEDVFGDKCVSGGRLNAYEALHYVAYHLEYHDSFVVSDSRNDTLEHDWVCSCGDRLEQRHSHSAETHVGSHVYHRLVCICGDYLTEAHALKFENIGNISYHKRSCEECTYTITEAHTWEISYVNPNSAQASACSIGGGDASIQAIPVYTCADCGYVSHTTPPDYGYN